MLNTGVWALRRSAWALGFLKRAYGVRVGSGGGGGGGGGSGGGGAAEAAAADAADAADAAAGAAFPFSLKRVSGGGGGGGGGGEGLVGGAARNATADAAASAAALRAMRAAPPGAENPLVRNRMWEQGGLLWQLAQGGAPIFAAEAGGDERGAACVDEEAEDDGVDDEGNAAKGAADGGPALLPPLPACAAARRFRDLAHAQFVPQRWLNAYPPAIASALRDHRGRPMHAAVARGDWVVSFSGCVGYFGQAECNRLFEAYAGEALGGGGGGGK